MNIKRVGVDLAKQVFQVHGVDCQDKAVLRKRLKRDQVLKFFATLPRCLVGMEACGGSHHWARELQKLGHDVKLVAPQFVKPYVKGNKNDANDAEATCGAAGRPAMRFVPFKERGPASGPDSHATLLPRGRTPWNRGARNRLARRRWALSE